ERGWRWCRRNKAVASLLGTVAATLLLGVVVSVFFALRASRHAAETQGKAEEARAEARQKEQQWQRAEQATQEKEQQRQEAEHRREEADRQKRLAQRRLFTSQLYRVEALFRTEPERARALLYDEDCCPTAERDFVWGLYNRWTQRHGLTLKGHTGFVLSVSFSPDGKTLASGSQDNPVRVWSEAPGQE